MNLNHAMEASKYHVGRVLKSVSAMSGFQKTVVIMLLLNCLISNRAYLASMEAVSTAWDAEYSAARAASAADEAVSNTENICNRVGC